MRNARIAGLVADSDSDDKSAYPAGHLAGVRTNPTRALRTRVFALQLWYGADDEQFKARVRVTRTTFLRILEAIAKPGEDVDGSGGLPRGRGRPAAPLWLKLMAVLYRLGQCCTINAGADFAGISNGSMCQNMQDICGRFRAVLFEKFVRWPTTPEERQRIRRGFADATDCPGDASPFSLATAAVDGSHAPVTLMDASQAKAWQNRKGEYSTLFVAACDHERRFLWVSAGHPGSTHDSAALTGTDMWQESAMEELEGVAPSKKTWFPDATFMLADAAFQLREFAASPRQQLP